MRTALASILAILLLLAATATAQVSSFSQPRTTLPEAPKALPAYLGDPSETYLFNAGVFCGVGASTSPASTKSTIGCGAGMTLLPLPIFFEVGVMGPQANRSYLSGYISIDGRIPLAPTSTKYLPMAIFGYSRLFETGHALDYGLAVALPRFKDHDSTRSLRIELRDYWTFANPAQHNVMLRFGWMSQVSD